MRSPLERRRYLLDILRLAKTYVPAKARWNYLLSGHDDWGPAHELAHAMIEPKWRFFHDSYGRCELSYCFCSGDECVVYEAAAMMISQKLLNRVDPALARREIAATEGYREFIGRQHRARAARLLKRLGLGRIPTRIPSLQELIERRMRAPDDRYARRVS